ncbi:DNA repair protein RecN [Auritidibacter sp. NML120779]|nr:DNA repair protein RecN [Auritidibacter sp. NML120779]
MIEHLGISSLGVIESGGLDLGPGFTALTGETGAGKTMIVTALNLLLGGRADASLIRRGDRKAAVEAEFILPENHPVAGLVEEAGGSVDSLKDNVQVLVSRTVTESSGSTRSRATAGGRSVPVSLLAAVGEHCIAIHGQSEQLRLRSATAQRQALDSFAGAELKDTLETYRKNFSRWNAVREELQALRAQAQDRALEAENLQRSLEEIDEAEITEAEDQELASTIARLENIEDLRSAATTARGGLAGEDDTDLNAPSAEVLVEAARQSLASSPGDDPVLQQLAQRLSEVGIQLADISTELASYLAGLDDEGPHALDQAQERRAELDRLKRLYGPELTDVLAWAQDHRSRLDELQGDTGRIEELETEEQQLHQAVTQGAEQLRSLRLGAGEMLSEKVTDELHGLLMPTAELTVRVSPLETFGPSGADDVAILLRPHPGSDPVPLGKGASGGELSRVMLALELVLADTDPVPTFVFDEIDAGVGGEAAVQIGQRLAALARRVQVIVVTHLPQVAAWADHHLKVTKNPDTAAGVTTSDVQELTRRERVEELARMLAGHADSSSAQEHARELLDQSQLCD